MSVTEPDAREWSHPAWQVKLRHNSLVKFFPPFLTISPHPPSFKKHELLPYDLEFLTEKGHWTFCWTRFLMNYILMYEQSSLWIDLPLNSFSVKKDLCCYFFPPFRTAEQNLSRDSLYNQGNFLPACHRLEKYFLLLSLPAHGWVQVPSHRDAGTTMLGNFYWRWGKMKWPFLDCVIVWESFQVGPVRIGIQSSFLVNLTCWRIGTVLSSSWKSAVDRAFENLLS